jgi:nitrate reductase assembly molybdenum cofactor insertion protein NarJ
MATPTVEALERRALAFCLAARLTAWPDDALDHDASTLAGVLASEGDGLERRLAALASGATRERLESTYIELFENGAGRCPIHETEYGRMRGMAKGNELADLAGFYAAFGLTRADGPHAQVLGDHLAVELEFYGTLLARQAALLEAADAEGVGVVEAARRSFLQTHLGRVAPAVASQPQVAGHPDYGPILGAARALVDDECRHLGVTPEPLDFVPGSVEADEVCCGATASPGLTR